ncbi:hypothetical protein EDC56_1820 [Sinobacterium caligoides]|uniref:Uncharacterized protein n=1 Tax=Sinobacterium caligoides TaxID=933926 RepID=A0A3N2DNY4_9GAMM|nr:YkgJ family cysteine cluster protein [Sinobacterium caligoides]ROS01379.1 hypothetical protein EDC56_1820 [Sinobacterium caligoides]
MQCRTNCGACCIAPSISVSLPALPLGKAAGERCPHLDALHRCSLFGQPQRPATCAGFAAEHEVCGDSRAQALTIIATLEVATQS